MNHDFVCKGTVDLLRNYMRDGMTRLPPEGGRLQCLYLDEMVVSPYCLLTGEKLAASFALWLHVSPICCPVIKYQNVHAINGIIETG